MVVLGWPLRGAFVYLPKKFAEGNIPEMPVGIPMGISGSALRGFYDFAKSEE